MVTLDEPGETPPPTPESTPVSTADASFSLGPVDTVPAPPTEGAPLGLDAIYSAAGIPPSAYPAERLLRLIDGLSAMDPATRLMAIQAMDAADESWTISDPLADAAAKFQALATHAERLQQGLQQVEQETQRQLDAVTARREQVVGDIRRQIAELEALAAREVERSTQETAEHEARLQSAREAAARELAQLSQTRARLQGLAAQFGAPQPSGEK